VEAEIERLNAANTRSEKELRQKCLPLRTEAGSDSAKIFKPKIMILTDAILMGTIKEAHCRELINAEFRSSQDEVNKYRQMMLAVARRIHARTGPRRG